ncbi:hypothetical protein ABZ319_16685 [Nocardia sp. NPDC005978]|uniref:hypothetical protein n=1 Tax=Nocardia sp. NPDC005978 TaxID=3156725 RepID=UPI00339FD09F
MRDDEIEFRGRRVELERGSDASEFRVLVDGRPIAMTFTETESKLSNTRSGTRTVREPVPVQWARASIPLPVPVRLDSSIHNDELRVRLPLDHHAVEGLGTVVHTSDTVYLRFGPDCAAVEVDLNHYTDTSS